MCVRNIQQQNKCGKCVSSPHALVVEDKEVPALGCLAGRRYGAKHHRVALLWVSDDERVWQAGIKHLLSDVHWQATKAQEAWLPIRRKESPKSHTKLRVWQQPKCWRQYFLHGNSVGNNLSISMFTETVLPADGERTRSPTVPLCHLPTSESYLSLPILASSTASTPKGVVGLGRKLSESACKILGTP